MSLGITQLKAAASRTLSCSKLFREFPEKSAYVLLLLCLQRTERTTC